MRMTRRIARVSTNVLAGAVWLLIIGLSGCGEDCKSAMDCKQMQQCVSGKCRAIESPDESDTVPAGDSEDTTEDSQPVSTDTNGDEESDEGADTDSTMDTDSDSSKGEGQDGVSCKTGSDCASGHCQNKICCAAGNCCAVPGDSTGCPTAVCKTVYCDGNYQCRYYNLTLGASDLSQETSCDGANRCDGNGACVTVSFCGSAAYKGLGVFTKEGDTLQEQCRETCSSAEHCNEGYECTGSDCSAVDTGNDTDCLLDANCTSGLCDESLSICCASGHCCLLDESCGRYACNEETRMCNTVCKIEEEDFDSACSSVGNYHCDNGWCYDDLQNGGKWCDEAGDCLSGYCDLTSALCCTEGKCCEDDDDCDKTRCQVDSGSFCPDTCAPEGVDDDTLCRPYYLCQDGVCISGALENGEICEENDMCASGRCANGYCCDQGECCASTDDCKQDSLCNTASCLGNNQCIYYAFACATYDIEGEETCVGDNRCDGFGNCVPVSECEGGLIGETYVCDEEVVAPDCTGSCENDDDCLAAYHCEDGACIDDLLPGEEGCADNLDCKDSHCNAVTAVCCTTGYCCNSNAQCVGFTAECDEDTHSCRLGCSADDECNALGDYYCASSVCEPRLPNGDRFCFEDADCVSDYCDESSGTCCSGGTCCISDDECKGFVCDEDHTCVSDCAGNDALCMEGYFCNVTVCEPEKPNGATCAADGNCASDHCDEESGVCCDGDGRCCLDASDCEDENRCLAGYCSASFSCIYETKADDELCSDDSFCNGDERCSGGVCTAGESPCSSGSVCLENTCDEDLDECLEVPVNAGEDCTASLFCIGNVAMKCTDMGICEDPGTGTPPCEVQPENPCMERVCNEDDNICEDTPKVNGVPCGDDPCEGDLVCEDGDCILSGNLPCDDGDLCTTDACSASEGQAVCGAHDPKEEGDPCDPNPCMGESAVCSLGYCIPSADRPCTDADLCTEDSCEASGENFECSFESRAPRYIACAGQTTFYSYDFTRELYTYNENCTGDYSGMETAVIVESTSGTVTLTVVATTPETDIEVLHLSDACDAATCLDHGTNSLAVQSSAEEQVFVLEVSGISPPSEMEVSVTCE